MSSDRTEKPTPKRREDARKKGQVARRPDLPMAFSFLAVVLMLSITGDDLIQRVARLFTNILPRAGQMEVLSPLTAHNLIIESIVDLGLITIPVIIAALITGISINFAQGGLTFTPTSLVPKWQTFNPLSNFKKIFGTDGPIEFAKGLMKLGFIIALSYGMFIKVIHEAPGMIGAPAPQIFKMLGAIIYDISLKAGVVFVLMAVLDYGYGYYKHEKSLKMTKQEIRDEYKQQEGDPMVKGQRKRAARAVVQRYLAAEIMKANVVVTNPTHFAVALRYDTEQDAAPIVVAKGADFVAKRIRELAKEHKVAIVENPPLARTLFRAVEVGQMIPPELYKAVAELLAYVYHHQSTNGKERLNINYR
jgi:flagellar biosynthesis protein FlhB